MEKISSNRLGAALEKAAKNAPISDVCPLIQNPRWNCRPHDKGNEPFCHNIAGYSRCVHYQQWFHHNLTTAIAKEMAKKDKKKK